MGARNTGWIRVMGLWFMGVHHGGVRHCLDRGDGIDLWGCAMGVHNTGWNGAMALICGSGRWDWFMGACDGGTRHWLDRGIGIDSWGVAVGARDTGWIGMMGLIYGGVQNWLERGDGIDSWGLAMGGTRHWLDQAMGLIYGDAWLDRFMSALPCERPGFASRTRLREIFPANNCTMQGQNNWGNWGSPGVMKLWVAWEVLRWLMKFQELCCGGFHPKLVMPPYHGFLNVNTPPNSQNSKRH